MPLAKVHVLEGQYDNTRLGKMSEAIQNALIEVLGVPPKDFFQIHHVLPRPLSPYAGLSWTGIL
jgi:hypothetical protein